MGLLARAGVVRRTAGRPYSGGSSVWMRLGPIGGG
jgi:hypothetical protein